MTNRQTKKAKRPLQTTLGKAPGPNDKQEVDLSRVRVPIHTNLHGLFQILPLLQTATEEVKEYLKYECDIIYECRSCRSLFRSIADFILHKRNYCRIKFKNYVSNCEDKNLQEQLKPPEPPEGRNVFPANNQEPLTKGLAPVIDRLKEKHEIKQLAQDLLAADLSRQEDNEEDKLLEFSESDIDLAFEYMANKSVAVFQNLLPSSQGNKKLDSMKTEVMEVHDMLEQDCAVLGADGKICNYLTNKLNSLKSNSDFPPHYFSCPECPMKFSTRKTLAFHLKHKHNDTRLVSVCPDCKETFANPWCVYRHLMKVHRKTLQQVRKNRTQICTRVIRKDQHTQKSNNKGESAKVDNADEENQWLNNIEGDNDFQMCGGCGKRFDRKAALQSHATMCSKRIAVCNSIKENNAKKKEEESKNVRNKPSSNVAKTDKPASPDETVLKGASKRKPYLLRTYKQPPVRKVFKSSENICDNVSAPTDVSKSAPSETVCDKKVDEQVSVCDNIKKEIEDDKGPGCDEKNNDSDVIQVCDDNNKKRTQKGRNNNATAVGLDDENVLDLLGLVGNEKFEVIKEESANDFSRDKNHINVDSESSSYSSGSSSSFRKSPRKSVAGSPENFGQLTRVEELKTYRENSSASSSDYSDHNSERDSGNGPEIRSPSKESCYGFPLLDEKTKKSCNKKIPFELDLLSSDKSSLTRSEEQKLSETNLYNNKTFEDSAKLTNCTKIIDENSRKLSQSPGKISVKKLEVLRGFPKEPEVPKNVLNKEMPILKPSVSPKSPKRTPKKLVLRKRARPLETRNALRRTSKQPKLDVKLDNQPFNLMRKATPYMDRSTLSCRSCKTRHSSLAKLLWHMSAHFNWFRFQCRRCAFVSFGKSECSKHAKETHEIQDDEISSIVLPIPDWKIQMMATEFRELTDEDDLGGKLTDEVKPCFDTDFLSFDNNEKHSDKNSIELFADTESDTTDFPGFSETETFSMPFSTSIKNECIDITDDDKDNFQLEVPEEIYPMDLFEGADDCENKAGFCINPENEDHSYVTANCSTAVDWPEERIKLGGGDMKNSTKNLGHNRPTRNRMRSIKTLQNDFYYDLGKTSKPSDVLPKVNGPHKQKKNSSSNVPKKDKEMTVCSRSK